MRMSSGSGRDLEARFSESVRLASHGVRTSNRNASIGAQRPDFSNSSRKILYRGKVTKGMMDVDGGNERRVGGGAPATGKKSRGPPAKGGAPTKPKKQNVNSTMLDDDLESYMMGDARAGKSRLDVDLDDYMQGAPNPNVI